MLRFRRLFSLLLEWHLVECSGTRSMLTWMSMKEVEKKRAINTALIQLQYTHSFCILHHISPYCTTYHHIALLITILHYLYHNAPLVTILHHISPYCTTYHHIAPLITILHHLSPYYTTYHHIAPLITILHHFCSHWQHFIHSTTYHHNCDHRVEHFLSNFITFARQLTFVWVFF